MLKIKDNVSFKKLEKLGFEKNINFSHGKIDVKYIIKIPDEYILIDKNNIIYIYLDDEYYCSCIYIETLEKIYDLIQAGLVEKVED